jgi:hypothetical protein
VSTLPFSGPCMASPNRWLHNDSVSRSIITKLRFQSMPETAKVKVVLLHSLALLDYTEESARSEIREARVREPA